MTGGPTFGYTYDVMDRIETMANGTDTLSWVYNLAGEVVSETSARNQSLVSYGWESGMRNVTPVHRAVSLKQAGRGYDANGSRTALALNGDLFASYGYDDASRLTSITRGESVFGFGYDSLDRRTSLTLPNGVNTTYSYDNLSRLTGIQAVKDLATISTFTYGYDDVGNRTSKNVGDHVENYGYDGLDRLTSVSRTGTAADEWRFRYDAVGNRTSTQVGTGEVVTPTFNNRNQMLQQSVGGALVVEGTLNEEGAVSVNGAPARMVTPTHFEATIESVPGTNAFTVQATDLSGNVKTDVYEVSVTGTASNYSYDAAGNLIGKTLPGETWTYTWNTLNQMMSASKNGVVQASFQYDPLGRRVMKSTPTKVTTYTHDGTDILRETVTVDGITTTSYYVHGPSIDEPLSKETDGVSTYYHADGLGSIVKETSAAGEVTNTLRYDAWGNIEAGARDGFAFTGREWDPETGLYYYRARYYDPKMGRFISDDPIGFAGGINLYSYAFESPARWRDPSGLEANINLFARNTPEWHAANLLVVSKEIYTIAAHGVPLPNPRFDPKQPTPDTAVAWGIGDRDPGNPRITPGELAAMIYSDPNWHGQRIWILACYTGNSNAESPHSYAEQVADALESLHPGWDIDVTGWFQTDINYRKVQTPTIVGTAGKSNFKREALPGAPPRQ